MNEVVNMTGGALSVSDLEASLQTTAAEAPVTSGDFHPYLGINRNGEWKMGQDKTHLVDGTAIALVISYLQKGVCAWGDGELLGEIMVPHNQPKPNKAELPDVGAPWKDQMSLQGMVMSGDAKGQEFIYKMSSAGGLKSIKAVIDMVLTQLRVDQVNIVPVCIISSKSYESRKYGTIHEPILTLDRWIDMDGVASEDVEPAEEPKTVTKTRSRAKK